MRVLGKPKCLIIWASFAPILKHAPNGLISIDETVYRHYFWAKKDALGVSVYTNPTEISPIRRSNVAISSEPPFAGARSIDSNRF